MRLTARLFDQPYLLLTLTSLFWAGNAIVGRAVAGKIPPVALAEVRWTGAFLLLLPFAWQSLKAELPLIRRHFAILLVLALTGIAAFNTMLYWALQHTTAINATLMQSAGPLVIGLWSLALFRDPLTRGQIAGIAVSLTGVLVIISSGDPARLAGLTLNAGDIAVLVAITIYAFYSTLLRKRPPMTQVSFGALTMGLGAALLLPLVVAEHLSGAHFAPIETGSMAALAYVVIFPSVVAHLFFNRGVQLIGANRAGPFLHLIPLFGAVLAVLVLGERPGLYHGVGAALILCGVVVATRGRSAAVRNRVAPGDR